MKTLLGIVLILVLLSAAIYVGVYQGLVLGVCDFVDGIQAEPKADGALIGWGIARFFILPGLSMVVLQVFMMCGVFSLLRG